MFKKRLLIIFFLLQLTAVHAEVYKWKDENGKTAYGDKPLSDDADIVEIKKRPAVDKHYQERLKKRQKLLDVMQEEHEEKVAMENEEKEKQEKQKQQCAKMRRELQETKNASLIYEKTDDPDNPRIYSDEERKAEEQKYEDYIDKNC